MENPWKTYGKPMENEEKLWKTYGKMWKTHGTCGKPLVNHGKPMENDLQMIGFPRLCYFTGGHGFVSE